MQPKKKKSRSSTRTKKKKDFWWEVDLGHIVNLEATQALLFELGSTGSIETATGLTAYFQPADYSSEKTLHAKLAPRLGPGTTIHIRPMAAQDWESEWKKNFKPRRVGKHFIVRPSWEKYKRKPKDIILVIDPKMSFGTGTHETTQLVLGFIESFPVKNKILLDVGSGTGILAIAAAKSGARAVYGFDVDTNAFENAEENIRRNRVSARVKTGLTTIETLPPKWPERYDIILANIQRAVFEMPGFMENLNQKMKPAGMMILSGILAIEDERMRMLFSEHNLHVSEFRADGEWVAYVLQRTS